jgi:regulator of protease activity HflC (stomatin/prohibitin superfamily)
MREEVYDNEFPIRTITIVIIAGLVIILSMVFLWKIVPAGNVGVYDTFGKVSDDIAKSGFHIKGPFTAIRPMSIKSQQAEEKATVPSKEGLIVTLDVSIIYHLEPDKAANIYKSVGINYPDVVIIPQLRSEIRDATASYEVKDLYTSGRTLVANTIMDKLKPLLQARGITLENVLLRDIALPDQINQAIQAKLTAQQQIEQKQFEVDKEKLEAQRKIVEAGGIAESQKIINNGLTSEYLTWYWISHIKDAQSIFYIPVGQDGLPIFKNVS